jgi:hypothetical protein
MPSGFPAGRQYSQPLVSLRAVGRWALGSAWDVVLTAASTPMFLAWLVAVLVISTTSIYLCSYYLALHTSLGRTQQPRRCFSNTALSARVLIRSLLTGERPSCKGPTSNVLRPALRLHCRALATSLVPSRPPPSYCASDVGHVSALSATCPAIRPCYN